MRFTSMVLSGLLALASAAPLNPVTRRDGTSIVSGLQFVQSNIARLNGTVSTLNPKSPLTVLTVLQILGQSSAVGNAVDAAIATANESEDLDDDESQAVAEAILQLTDTLESFLPNIASKKPAFDKAVLYIGSVSPQVLRTLEEQKASSAELGTAITAKLNPFFAGFAPLIQARIGEAFDQAIAVFRQPGGLIPLPPLPI